MLRIAVTLSILLVGAMNLIGCATVMRGTTQDIGISSNPSGASITIDNQFHGVTPTIVQLSRNNSHFLLIELEGYGPVSAKIISQPDAAIAGNCLLGGIPGIAVDAVTGSANILTPEVIHVALVPLDDSLSHSKQPQPTQPHQVQVPQQVPRREDQFVALARELVGAALFGCCGVLLIVWVAAAEGEI